MVVLPRTPVRYETPSVLDLRHMARVRLVLDNDFLLGLGLLLASVRGGLLRALLALSSRSRKYWSLRSCLRARAPAPCRWGCLQIDRAPWLAAIGAGSGGWVSSGSRIPLCQAAHCAAVNPLDTQQSCSRHTLNLSGSAGSGTGARM